MKNKKSCAKRKNKKNTDLLTGILKTFRDNFQKQIKIYIEKQQIETGKKIKPSAVKKDLSMYLGMGGDVRTISNWFRGKNIPEIDTIVLIANFFNCSIDELLTDNNPYENVKQNMLEKGFSEQAIKKMELWLRKVNINKSSLFEPTIQSNSWYPFDFLNSLLSNIYIDKLIQDFYMIFQQFLELGDEDIKNLNSKIPELNEDYFYIDSTEVLNLLVSKFPENKKSKISNFNQNINILMQAYTASYILKLYKDAAQKNKID